MFDSIIKILLPPAIGGIIGWTTNAIAIWMLFHPYKQKRIFGCRIPFTPGLIPSRINNLAESIASITATHILTHEELLSLANSLELDEKIVEDFFERIKNILTPGFLKFIPLKRKLKETLKSELRRIIKSHLDEIMEKVPEGETEKKMQELIKQRIIKEFSPHRIEKVVYEVCRTELHYIMLFGGILGAVMGLFMTAASYF